MLAFSAARQLPVSGRTLNTVPTPSTHQNMSCPNQLEYYLDRNLDVLSHLNENELRKQPGYMQLAFLPINSQKTAEYNRVIVSSMITVAKFGSSDVQEKLFNHLKSTRLDAEQKVALGSSIWPSIKVLNPTGTTDDAVEMNLNEDLVGFLNNLITPTQEMIDNSHSIKE